MAVKTLLMTFPLVVKFQNDNHTFAHRLYQAFSFRSSTHSQIISQTYYQFLFLIARPRLGIFLDSSF